MNISYQFGFTMLYNGLSDVQGMTSLPGHTDGREDKQTGACLLPKDCTGRLESQSGPGKVVYLRPRHVPEVTYLSNFRSLSPSSSCASGDARGIDTPFFSGIRARAF